MAIRIVIADDHTVLRLGLKTLLDMQPDMEVVGEVGEDFPEVQRPRPTKQVMSRTPYPKALA